MMVNPVKTTSMANIGDLLLKGWTMLADSCLDCKVPLMQDPQSGGRLCVNCQGMSCASPSEPAEWQGRALGYSQGKHQGQSEILEEQEGEEDTWDERLKPFMEAHPMSSGIDITHNVNPNDPASTEPRCQTEANAEKLAVKMTQGWILTSTYCPRCHTPLVRSRESSLFCVGCDVMVVSQKQPQSSTSSPLLSSMRASQKRSQCPSRDDDSNLRDTKKLITLEKSRDECDAERPQGEDMELDGVNGGRKFIPTETVSKGPQEDSSTSTWKLSTRSTLIEKIDQATMQLRITSVTDPDNCLKMTELISSCCDILQKLNALEDSPL